nr:hypothetical protein [Solibacillus sp. R5-41]
MTFNNRTVEDFKEDLVWGSLPAVKNNHLYVGQKNVHGIMIQLRT